VPVTCVGPAFPPVADPPLPPVVGVVCVFVAVLSCLHWLAPSVLPVANWLQTAALLFPPDGTCVPGGSAAAPAGNAIAAAIPQARAPSLHLRCMGDSSRTFRVFRSLPGVEGPPARPGITSRCRLAGQVDRRDVRQRPPRRRA